MATAFFVPQGSVIGQKMPNLSNTARHFVENSNSFRMSSVILDHDSTRLTDPTSGMRRLTTSKLRNELGKVIDSMKSAPECMIVVTHAKPKAVLVPYEQFLEMLSERRASPALSFLAATYDQIAETMNTPVARAAAVEAFDSGPEVFRGRPLKS